MGYACQWLITFQNLMSCDLVVLGLTKYKVAGQPQFRIHSDVDQIRALDVIRCLKLKGGRGFYCAVNFLKRQAILSRAASSSVVD